MHQTCEHYGGNTPV